MYQQKRYHEHISLPYIRVIACFKQVIGNKNIY